MNSSWPRGRIIGAQTAAALIAMMGAGVLGGSSAEFGEQLEERLPRRPGETKEEHEARAKARLKEVQEEIEMKEKARQQAEEDYQQRQRDAYEAAATPVRADRAARKAAAYAKRQPKGKA